MNGLKALREKRLMTQEELAAASGVSVATIFRLEKGRVRASVRTVKALAKPLAINPEELYEILSAQPRLL